MYTQPSPLSPLLLSRLSNAALQPFLVHGGAPGHAGHPGELRAAQLLGAQRRGLAGADRVEEGRHLHEFGLGREAASPSGRLAVLRPCGPFKAQQAGRGHVSVRGQHRQCGLHLQPHGAPRCSR